MRRAHSVSKAMTQLRERVGAQQPQRVTQMSTHEPELTPWFDGHVCPEREGVYKRKFNDASVTYSRYVNLFWRCGAKSPDVAARQISISIEQHIPWRGLKEEAK